MPERIISESEKDERAVIYREDQISGISVEADGNYMWYAVAYDQNGNVIDVIRRWQDKTRVFATSLASCIDAHYHPAPGKHGWYGTYPDLGRHVLTLGGDLNTFGAAFEAMWFELAICKGKILPFEQRPQTDLTLQALMSFANGFRQAAISFNLEGISLQAEELLSEFPT